VYACLEDGHSFLVEAGAGAGKTYTLIEVLQWLIDRRGRELVRNRQRIACITYTNIAKTEIQSRTDRNQAVQADTIHAFCWSLIRQFQPLLRSELAKLKGWDELLADIEDIGDREIEYSLGIRRVEQSSISLGHADVLPLMVRLMEREKFRKIISARYPVILIDEYQDTDAKLIDCLERTLLQDKNGPQFGFFGDSWQKIYGNGCGNINVDSLAVVGKRANFRSAPAIVECLNRMRPDLPQEVGRPDAEGEIVVFHTNSWPGERRTGGHWKGDLQPGIADAYRQLALQALTEKGWDLSSDKTKILMLTHAVLASAQGYSSLPDVFRHNEAFVDKEDPYIEYLVDVLEPACAAYTAGRHGEMIAVLAGRQPLVASRERKGELVRFLGQLQTLRANGTVGDVLDHIREGGLLRLPTKVESREIKRLRWPSELEAEEPSWLSSARALRQVQYREISSLASFVSGDSSFSTKHGVKGAQFENVVAVFGRGWNLYNFGDMLASTSRLAGIPAARQASYERNRNLFYVACSRARDRLALLFTLELSEEALDTLRSWFGEKNIGALPSPSSQRE
jgi:DNA helicase-2/ATP-dependent DNA helicase PcrA